MRKLTLTLEPVSGTINLFYAFVNGEKVIAADGTKKRQWSHDISEGQTRIKTRVTGIDNASYKLGIDLPETANDQSLTFNLDGGYHETELLV
jgi:hypothetical protein